MESVDKLASALLDDEGDYISVFHALEPLLTPPAFVALGAALELCPLHYCDIRICLDDREHGEEVYTWPRKPTSGSTR